jgi:hypothetical protein
MSEQPTGTKLRDFIQDEPEVTNFDKTVELEETAQVESVGPRFSIPPFLKAQTGPGEIEDYMTHPLNFSKSMGLAQMIRGITGIVGELRYAVLDIVMGFLQFSKERKAVRALGGAALHATGPRQGH